MIESFPQGWVGVLLALSPFSNGNLCLPLLDVPCGIFRWVLWYTDMYFGLHGEVRGDDSIEKKDGEQTEK